jgi:phage terminase large subunit
LVNGSQIQLVGSADKDKLMGTNPVGVLFSEFALADPACLAYVRPILAANGGWQIICSTPRGHNALYELYQIAQKNPEWYCSKLTLDDTRHISRELIEAEILSGETSRDLAEQEYFTSFSLGLEGSFYARAVDRMRLKDQITQVPAETHLLTHVAYDIGLDTTALIFFQLAGPCVRIIDYYENSNLSLEHYVNIIKSKPYTYGKHIGPHDIANREYTSGVSRLEIAKNLGIKFVIAPSLSIPDGIEAVRAMLSRTWIDETNCKQLIKAIENYRQAYDEKRKTYTGRPCHNLYSHACDALRMLAIYLPKLSNGGTTAEELDRRFREATGGSTFPKPFQDVGFNHSMF